MRITEDPTPDGLDAALRNPDAATDEELVGAAQRGSRDAMDRLLRRHYDRVWGICRRIAANDADAADATQEALLLIVRRIDTFDGRARFSTWSHRVATNACLDELRRRKRRPSVGLTDDDAEDGRATADVRPGPDAVGDRLDIDAALATLPEEFRAPLVLRDLIGHDYAEISEILGIPPGTVRSRIARARTRLAALLDSSHETSAVTSGAGPGTMGAGNQGDDPERPIPQP